MGASSYSFTEMLHNTLPHYRRIVKPDDKVLIISDTRVEDDVPHVFAAAARTLDAIPTIMVITPLARDYMDPPEAVFRAAEASDVLHYAASTAFAHSQFGVQMTKLQKRRINSDNIDARQLVSGAILAHIDDINVWRRKISKYWEEGSKVHITSALGTDLWISIEGRRPFRGHNFPHIQFPGGEAMLAPMEDTAEGVLMVDKCVHFIGDLRVPIKLTIEKGTIKKIEGGDEARRFERWLEENSDDNGYRLCELAVGTNPEAYFMGSPRQDRFILGSSHVGFGLNNDVGGVIDSNIHYDCIYSCPTIEVDEEVIIRNGKILV